MLRPAFAWGAEGVVVSFSEQALPRQTYKTENHDRIEEEVADRFALWTNSVHLKIGTDPAERMKSAIDRLFYRNTTVLAFAEIKSSSYEFESERLPRGWSVGADKIEAGRRLGEIVRVPVYMIVRFAGDEIVFFDMREAFERHPNFGRDDRGDAADRELGARFKWTQFRRMGE